MTLLLEKTTNALDTVRFICANYLLSINVGIGITFMALVILMAHFSFAVSVILCPIVSFAIVLGMFTLSRNVSVTELRKNAIGCLIGHLWTIALVL